MTTINDQINELFEYYPGIWENKAFQQINPVTGATEVVEFNYTTNLTSTIDMPGEMNDNWHFGTTDIYTGTTNNSLFARID